MRRTHFVTYVFRNFTRWHRRAANHVVRDCVPPVQDTGERGGKNGLGRREFGLTGGKVIGLLWAGLGRGLDQGTGLEVS